MDDIIVNGESIVSEIKSNKYAKRFDEEATYYIVDPNNDLEEYSKPHQRYYEKLIQTEGGKTDNKVSEEILEKYFTLDEALRKNTGPDYLQNVLVKVTLLNAFYRTAINNIHLVAVARHINCKEMNFDGRIKSNGAEPNFDLVHDIAYKKEINDYRYLIFPVKKKGGVKKEMDNMYSFATKYCAWHQPDVYPIVDRYTMGMLYRIVKENQGNERLMELINEPNLTQPMLVDYRCYYRIVKGLKEYLHKYLKIDLTFKELDIFLWSYGAEHGITV